MGIVALNDLASDGLYREEVAEILGRHVRTVKRHEERRRLRRIEASNGDRRVRLDRRSVAKLVGPDRLLRYELQKLEKRRQQENATPEQPSLFARSEIDDQYEALVLSGATDSDIKRALYKHDAVRQVLKWRELGYPTKRAAGEAMEEKIGEKRRTIQIWEKKLKESGLLGLLDKRPGPAKRSGTKCTPSAEAIVRDGALKGLSDVQIHALLMSQPNAQPVSRTTVLRWRKHLGPLVRAAARGSDARKAACGYIDRSWEDCKAGEQWCMDEWLADFFVYDENNAQDFGRPHIVTLLDARSRCVLDFEMTLHYSHETVLDIVERALHNHPRPDYFYSDRGGWFRGKLGRNFRVIPNEKIFGPAASALEQVGVCRRGPREEKNPRANPVEPFNGYLADHAPELSTYCGSNPDERPERCDAQLAEHEALLRGKAKSTPLITLSEGRLWLIQNVEKYNCTPSRANGLRGLAPMAAYRAFATDEDRERRRVEPGLLLLAFAESFPGVAIRQGGVIELKGVRYSDPQLLLLQGERRDIRRIRHDKSFIVTIPAFKGESPVVARRRVPVGTHDAESLSVQCELLASVRKIVAESMTLPERGQKPERAPEVSSPQRPARPLQQRAWSSENFIVEATLVVEPPLPRLPVAFVEEAEAREDPVPTLHDLKPMEVVEG
jgi:transposase InsO family protein